MPPNSNQSGTWRRRPGANCSLHWCCSSRRKLRQWFFDVIAGNAKVRVFLVGVVHRHKHQVELAVNDFVQHEEPAPVAISLWAEVVLRMFVGGAADNRRKP